MKIKKLLASFAMGACLLAGSLNVYAAEPAQDLELDTAEEAVADVEEVKAVNEEVSLPDGLVNQWDITESAGDKVKRGSIVFTINEDGSFTKVYPGDESCYGEGNIIIYENTDEEGNTDWYGEIVFDNGVDLGLNDTIAINEDGQLVITMTTLGNTVEVYEVHKTFLDYVTDVNDAINSFVWVKSGLWLLIGTGVLMTIVTGFFQITHLPHWIKKTIGGVFKKDSHNKDQAGAVSQFQALCTALAATIGTGNIAGVAAAICVGGPGAVFWMWLAAFFGMMTNFSENVLGIYFRRKNNEGEWSGGAMYYLQDGLGAKKGFGIIGKILAIAFACFAVLASFGIGNLGQINKIVYNINSAFFSNFSEAKLVGNIPLVPFIIGLCLMTVGGFIIIGGLKRIAAVAERVVPFMAVVYVIGAIVICILHFNMIGAAFVSIFKFAFGIRAVAGGAVGVAITKVITQGCKRGVFSNEAGLGSSVMVHSNSDVKEPVKQGLWGIFEVFADTFIVCTMTAIVCLTSGYIDLSTGLFSAPDTVTDANLVAKAFGNTFGPAGEWFIAIAILLFAFTTVLGWSHYGSKAVEYLFNDVLKIKGRTAIIVYKSIFVVCMMAGALATSSLAWDISDTFNGLMMVPNLIGVIALFPLVRKITKNYTERKIKGSTEVEPILSFDEEIQKEHAELVKNGAE